MKETLADLFWRASGPTVQYEGLTVHGAVFRYVKKPGRFRVRFLASVQKPIQALCIDIDPGKLIIEDEAFSKTILRRDTAPDVVLVGYQPSRNGSKITLYNSWINKNGGIEAWLVHAGMLVEETGDKMILRCSDGLGEPTFDDLVVEVTFLQD